MKITLNLKQLLFKKNSILNKNTLNYSKFSFSSLVNYTREDLTRKWLTRVQSKANDPASQESVTKLSSLIDFYTKKAENVSEDKNLQINWDEWRKEIRTPGIVDKLQHKLEEAKTQKYNVDSLASKAALTSDKYDHVGLFLRYNHDLYMNYYTETLEALYSTLSLGDMSMVSNAELMEYNQGATNQFNGWTETGYMSSGN